MDSILKDYTKYKWFFTSSEKLVVGGKSAEQNDELIRKIKSYPHDSVVMHTHAPGSPFSFIVSPPEEVSKKDLEETAVFTGCFSRAWKLGKKKAIIDIFRAAQLYKNKDMKLGTWGVHGKIQKTTVDLKLVLAKQKNSLRALPEAVLKNKKDILLVVYPGKVDKSQMLSKIMTQLNNKFNQEEVLTALPAGGVAIA